MRALAGVPLARALISLLLAPSDLKMRDFLKMGGLVCLCTYGLACSLTFQTAKLVLRNSCPLLSPPPPFPPPATG